MKSIKLDRKLIDDSDYTDSNIDIDDKQLTFYSYDVGSLMKQYAPTSRDEYEYSVSVDREQFESLILELLKDKFTDANEFMEWLKAKDITFEFYNN